VKNWHILLKLLEHKTQAEDTVHECTQKIFIANVTLERTANSLLDDLNINQSPTVLQ